MRNTPTARLLELDALRGLAALGVVFFHFTMLRPQAAYGFKLGVTGVDLFFIISGFVILMTLERTESWKDFAIGRLARLYPAYWVCVTLTAILILTDAGGSEGGRGPLLPAYLANLSMFQLYFHVPDLDNPYWTLVLEMSFYLFMLGVFLARRLGSIETIAGVALAAVFLFDTPHFKAHFTQTYLFLAYWVPILHYLPLFLSGIYFHRIRFHGPRPWLYLMLALCFLCQTRLFIGGGPSRHFISYLENMGMLAGYYALFLAYVHGRLGFLVNPATLYLGRISYSLYLCHQYLGFHVLIPRLTRDLDFAFWPAFGTALIAVMALAALITEFVERPAMRFVKSRFLRPKPS